MIQFFKSNAKYKDILIYGISMFLLFFLLKTIEAQYYIMNYKLEFFVGVNALIFTFIGIWIARNLVRPQVVINDNIRSKEIPNSTPINEVDILKFGISKRELEVLNLMTSGLSNDEIATNLFISLNTVKTHCSNIYSKLDVKRRTQAVEKAKRLKLIN